MTPPTRSRRGPLLAAAVVLAAAGLASSAPATAVTAAPQGDCLTAVPDRSAARTTRPADGPDYTTAQLRRIDRRLDERLEALGRARAALPADGVTLRIGVHVHVVAGEDGKGATKRRVREQLRILDSAYAGGQSPAGSVTRFDFYLASFQRVHRPTWHNARIGGSDDLAMRHALHRGGPQDLNLYILEPRDPYAQAVVLGWATPPNQARRQPQLDGVVIHQESLPGGTFGGYNRGDTAVHEIGHWLGLFHTFEGGCDGPGDLVDDTPAQSVASSACDPTKDTCTLQPGLDPVNNFMDYAIDDCMNMFTPGQVARMHDNWLAYRTP